MCRKLMCRLRSLIMTTCRNGRCRTGKKWPAETKRGAWVVGSTSDINRDAWLEVDNRRTWFTSVERQKLVARNGGPMTTAGGYDGCYPLHCYNMLLGRNTQTECNTSEATKTVGKVSAQNRASGTTRPSHHFSCQLANKEKQTLASTESLARSDIGRAAAAAVLREGKTSSVRRGVLRG
ncbi:hypothetical protein DL89DRAFT_157646 [Linderina pennispora]|uniref:Uncharacterized protein n=1 Tax=Linderina pennispora TaxID=61395 RepID=A0A1Y1VU01_9FUNG|nr:uncharacterized protein DL89DRAFT_157646 [Linderina pennispora]ORX64788.1 hypothetical protein DL89DRAFT_157646 [Linderina pennispora]